MVAEALRLAGEFLLFRSGRKRRQRMRGLPRTNVDVRAPGSRETACFRPLLPKERKLRQRVASDPGEYQEQHEQRRAAPEEQQPRSAKDRVQDGSGCFPSRSAIGHQLIVTGFARSRTVARFGVE